jgi:hypothetical protein
MLSDLQPAWQDIALQAFPKTLAGEDLLREIMERSHIRFISSSLSYTDCFFFAQ